MTVLAQLIASDTDSFGYVTYVFKRLDELAKEAQYVMCVRYPNWNHRLINLGEKGFLSFLEVKAGEDKWFNGKDMVPYNYSAIQFLKFINMPETLTNSYVM